MANPDRARHAAHATRSNRLGLVALLSSPAIVGTGFFLTGAIVSKVFGPGHAPDPTREFTSADHIELALGSAAFFACYFGAAFGPLLLPAAGWQAFALRRAAGARSKTAAWAGTIVALGVVAAALFWGWLIDLDIFV